MTLRDRYLAALRNAAAPDLIWAPNFDYWLNVNRAEGTLPPRYLGMSRNDIVRAVGGAIWNRASGLRVEYDRGVRHEAVSVDGGRVETFHTPLGSIRQVYREAEGPHRAKFLAEHYVKDLESLRIRKYVVEATRHVPNYEPARQALRETGDDGVGMSDNVPPDADFTRVEAVAGLLRAG